MHKLLSGSKRTIQSPALSTATQPTHCPLPCKETVIGEISPHLTPHPSLVVHEAVAYLSWSERAHWVGGA